MATNTTNYSLSKPGTLDQVNVATDLDGNYDIIDAEMGTGPHWPATDSGWLAWSGDPGMYTNATVTFATHVYFLSSLRVHVSATTTKVGVLISTRGTTTDLRYGLYDSTGTRVATTGNVTASVTGTGLKTASWATPFAITPGKYYIVLWAIASVSMVYRSATISDASAFVASNDPAGSTAIRRYGRVSDGGSATDIPASLTVSGGVVSSPAFVSNATDGQIWVAIL